MARKTSPLEAAQARCNALHAALGDAQASANKARARLDDALLGVERAKAARAAAEHAYSDAPSRKNEKRLLEATQQVTLAEARCTRPRSDAIAADEAVRVATLALEGAREELAGLEREQRISQAKQAASVGEFRTVSAPHFSALLEAYRTMRAAAEKIDMVLAASRDASAELRKEGIACEEASPLGEHHLIAPLVSEGSSGALAKFLASLTYPMQSRSECPTSFARTIVIPLLEEVRGLQRQPSAPGEDRVFEAMIGQRTLLEANKSATELRRQLEAERAEAVQRDRPAPVLREPPAHVVTNLFTGEPSPELVA